MTKRSERRAAAERERQARDYDGAEAAAMAYELEALAAGDREEAAFQAAMGEAARYRAEATRRGW